MAILLWDFDDSSDDDVGICGTRVIVLTVLETVSMVKDAADLDSLGIVLGPLQRNKTFSFISSSTSKF